MVVKTKGNKRRWYRHETHTGWKKDDTQGQRRRLALQGHGGDLLATARGLMGLANVSRDSETARRARADALYFYRQYALKNKKAKR